MAQKCVECPACSLARRKQRGFAFVFVKFIEGGICPFCKAYERVYGRKAHEPAWPRVSTGIASPSPSNGEAT